ncbi:MAG TPA: dihydrofolate reductase [Geomonas sp.]|nr:dihydrofolate reductase [Geomonas sp.]
MIISLIAAMSEERVIGRDGKLPWQIPADLTRFKTITIGHTVLMGRKTFQSIGHPLPGRRNIVLSRTVKQIEGCEIARSLQEGISAAEGEEELFICGGQEIFREALPFCQRIYLTIVHASFQGDVYFPQIPEQFQETYIEERPELTPPLSFLVYEKVEPVRGGSASDLRKKAREAIQRQLYFLARNCLEQSLTLEDDPAARSDLGFCLVKSGGDQQTALRLAEQALESRPADPHLHLNLGRIQIAAGDKEQGVATLRKAMGLGGGPEIIAALGKLGIRRPPPIKSLPRSHPLNKYLGLFLSRLGLR